MRSIISALVVSTALATAGGAGAAPDPVREELTVVLQELIDRVAAPEAWPDQAVALEMSELSVTGERFRFEGAASSAFVYSSFLEALEQDPRFEDVAMGKMSRKPWGVVFQVSSRFIPKPTLTQGQPVLDLVSKAAWPHGVRLDAAELVDGVDGAPSRVTMTGWAWSRDIVLGFRARVQRKLKGSRLRLGPIMAVDAGFNFRATLSFHEDGRTVAAEKALLQPGHSR